MHEDTGLEISPRSRTTEQSGAPGTIEPPDQAAQRGGRRGRRLAVAGVVALGITTLAAVSALSALRLGPFGQTRATRTTSPAATTTTTTVCPQDMCFGGSPMRVEGPPVPFVWTLPHDWVQEYTAGRSYEDAAAETADGTAGFVLIEHVGAADPTDFTRPPADPPGPGAKALADWLATRPYLRTTQPAQTTVGGWPAWRLDARVGPLPRGAKPMGRAGIPGVYLVRLLPPQADTDQMAAWFDVTYTSPTRLWLIDLPNGTVGYVEAGSADDPHQGEIARILQQMRFEGP